MRTQIALLGFLLAVWGVSQTSEELLQTVSTAREREAIAASEELVRRGEVRKLLRVLTPRVMQAQPTDRETIDGLIIEWAPLFLFKLNDLEADELLFQKYKRAPIVDIDEMIDLDLMRIGRIRARSLSYGSGMEFDRIMAKTDKFDYAFQARLNDPRRVLDGNRDHGRETLEQVRAFRKRVKPN